MTIVLTILHIIFCFTLIAVILLQAGRGQGLTGPAFGGGNVQSLFGTQAADFLTKATTVAAICFLLTSIGLDWLEVRKSKSLFEAANSQTTTLDMDQIKKAMEQIESENALKEAAAEASDEASSTAQAVAQDATATVTDIADQAKEEASKVLDENLPQS